jgi:uncharacterized surface protein with fasciclin (FAS1) repeats
MKQSRIVMVVIGIIVVGIIGYFAMNMLGGATQTNTAAPVEAQAEAETTVETEESMGTKTIVDVASENGNFKTLVAAVQAAGLAETLSGEGPFTVFAPTDAAFAKLPPGTVESLLQDKEKLTQILTYHVVPGKVMASEVVTLPSAKTVQGGMVTIKAENGMVMVNDATVTQTDIEASNGVIHVIDTVIMPQ